MPKLEYVRFRYCHIKKNYIVFDNYANLLIRFPADVSESQALHSLQPDV